ncbi:MAG: HAMP domain-containing sensor histidine kinase [Patescibacteria group bacterium]
MRRRKKLRLVRKFILIYSMLAIVFLFVFGSIFYWQFTQFNFTNIQKHAMSTAVLIAETVDFTGLETITQPQDQFGTSYKRIFLDLNYAAAIQPDVAFVYAMRQRSDGQWVFTIDADIEEDDNNYCVIDPDERSAEIGEFYDVSCCPDLPNAIYGPSVDQEITHDEWGSWISGYAPIYDNNGSVIGIVGVDIFADEVISSNSLVANLITITLILAFILSFIGGLIGIYAVKKQTKEIQKELEIRNEDLERLVKTRTNALEKLMAMAVHELRAPLTSARFGVESLCDLGKCNKGMNERIKQVTGVMVGMSRLVSDILEASKANLKKTAVKKTQGSFGPLVNQIADEFKVEAINKGLKLDVQSYKNLPKFWFDPEKMTQVLRNLTSNAVKYTDSGSITIITSYLASKKMLRLEVVDTGIGMTEKQMKQIFEPFVRVNSGEQEGTGLGLAIVKGIVEAHGGKVGVKSIKGQGSTFWFEIPNRK